MSDDVTGGWPPDIAQLTVTWLPSVTMFGLVDVSFARVETIFKSGESEGGSGKDACRCFVYIQRLSLFNIDKYNSKPTVFLQ